MRRAVESRQSNVNSPGKWKMGQFPFCFFHFPFSAFRSLNFAICSVLGLSLPRLITRHSSLCFAPQMDIKFPGPFVSAPASSISLVTHLYCHGSNLRDQRSQHNRGDPTCHRQDRF
jgi:hypothetical protein